LTNWTLPGLVAGMRVARFAKIAAIQAVIFLVGLAAVELVLRQFLPLPAHGGEYRDASGSLVRIARDADTMQPGLNVRHIASEFSAQIRTGHLGYRKMSNESLTPDLLFLGDSFTFGHGVSDDQVFSEVFCKKRGTTCLNLGRSGTNTFDQVRLLRYGMDTHQLRPKTVVLTMLAACWLGVAGNDLGDNLTFYRNAKRSDRDVPLVRAGLAPPLLTETLRGLQGWLSNFEITKRLLIVASSGLKRGVYACSNTAELDAAANATSVAFAELAGLAQQYGFKVIVTVIHPFQDLDGGYRTSEAAVGRALPASFGCIPSGASFRHEQYFPYDGHFNALGHANLAAVLDATVGRASATCVPTR
jgi:hypothetical protein